MRFAAAFSDSSLGDTKSARRASAQAKNAAQQAFRDHDARIRPLLPPSVQQLLDTPVHDARIKSLTVDAARKTLQMRWEYCDTPGCVVIQLNYSDITLTPMETSLLCFIAHEESAEVYWQEVDLDESSIAPVYVHRILWQTSLETGREPAEGTSAVIYKLEPEIELRFGGLEIAVTASSENDDNSNESPVTVVGSENNVNRSFAL